MASPAFAQVTPHIYKLDLPFFGGRLPVAVWLVRGDDGWLMVDGGAPGFEKAVMEQILACTGGELPVLMVLTHGHADHAAAAQQVREQWRIPIAAGRLEIPYLLGPAAYKAIAGGSLGYKLLQISSPALVGRNVQRPLDEGDRLGGLQVFHVPGHAPGMIALLHAEDRALISADVFYNLGGKLGDPRRSFTYSPALNHQSQAKLAALDFDHLLPSHGPVILNTGREQARALVAKNQKRRRPAAGAAAAGRTAQAG